MTFFYTLLLINIILILKKKIMYFKIEKKKSLVKFSKFFPLFVILTFLVLESKNTVVSERFENYLLPAF